MRIDWSLDLSSLISLGVVVLGVLSYVRTLEKKLDRIDEKVGYLWNWFKKAHGIDEEGEKASAD